MIKNLNQLKKSLKGCPRLKIVGHCRPECVGQVRHVTLANTQGFYSVMDGQPEHRYSQVNGGRGSYLAWDKASSWTFANGICSIYEQGADHRLIMAFRVLDAA